MFRKFEIYGDTLFALGSASIDGINSGGFFAVRLSTEKVEINEIVNDNDANVTLDWEMNPNIRTLEIIQSDGENEVSSGRIERDVTSYTFESTTPNVTYTYQIISRNLFGQAESSSQTYEIVQPEAPANLTAERQEELVLLNWEDLSDNETGFTIYRSADNGDFEALASTEPDVVTFTDESAVLSSAYTYVVEATSENFRSERTNEAIIDIVLSVDQDELFRIYPNPSDGIIGISSSTVIDRIEILDVSGRLLEQHQVNKTQLVRDLSGLENGVYILRIHAKNSLKTQRIILD
ncbi:MAG: T9SS type A sorting domain-containing protein [Cytophagales bacterium]|nr:T9SS type A sorting domain-containing protein [Cytophagales bacterium]